MNDLMERQGHPVKLHNLFRNVINLKAGIRPIRKSTTFLAGQEWEDRRLENEHSDALCP